MSDLLVIEEPKNSFRRLLLFCVLSICLLGSILYPYWWHRLLFEGGILKGGDIVWTLDYLYWKIPFRVFAIIIAIGIGAYAFIPRSRQYFSNLHYRTNGLNNFFYTDLGHKTLISVFIIWVIYSVMAMPFFAEYNKRSLLSELTKQGANSIIRKYKNTIDIRNNVYNLLYSNNDSISQTYSQIEPEIEKTKVISSEGSNTSLQAGLPIGENTATAEISNSTNTTTEYSVKPDKTQIKKIISIIAHLQDNDKILGYNEDMPEAPEASELDKAAKLLRSLDITYDQSKLNAFQTEFANRDKQSFLTSLGGYGKYIIIAGLWEHRPNSKGFIELKKQLQFTQEKSKLAVKLQVRKVDLIQSTRDLMDEHQGKPIQLVVFGKTFNSNNDTGEISLFPLAFFN